jgi:hypothetical protein
MSFSDIPTTTTELETTLEIQESLSPVFRSIISQRDRSPRLISPRMLSPRMLSPRQTYTTQACTAEACTTQACPIQQLSPERTCPRSLGYVRSPNRSCAMRPQSSLLSRETLLKSLSSQKNCNNRVSAKLENIHKKIEYLNKTFITNLNMTSCDKNKLSMYLSTIQNEMKGLTQELHRMRL